MNPIDKNYLSLQFKDRIHSKNGLQFQSFFEEIMEKAFPDFQRIRPYGKDGDGGNDGYRKEKGIYYQVYSPNTPSIKDADAASKLAVDFGKLQSNWEGISKIREYYFVFNDKYLGSTQIIESTLAELCELNNKISFGVFLAKNLEAIFFQLNKNDFLSLGFDIDSRKAISNAYDYLQHVEVELDKDHSKFASTALDNVTNIILSLCDESLELELEILKCRCLDKLEHQDEAMKKYNELILRYPNDPRPFLYLSEMHLLNGEFDKNNDLLGKAEKIDPDYWLLKLQFLLRKYFLNDKVSFQDIDEESFPVDKRHKSCFYRIYSNILINSGNTSQALTFLEKAIHLNPDRLGNHISKLTLLEMNIFQQKDFPSSDSLHELLKEIDKVEDLFNVESYCNSRSKSMLNFLKLDIYRVLEDNLNFLELCKKIFELLLSCNFDIPTEQILTSILMQIHIHDDDLNRLESYLLKSWTKEISDQLAKALILQYNFRATLFSAGINFFKQKNKLKFVSFIEDIQNANFENVIAFIIDDIPFSALFANSASSMPELRKKIIEILPNDKNIQKDKLLLLLNYDEGNFDQALNFLRKLNLSELNHQECLLAMKVAQKKEAWDFLQVILNKLLEEEKDENNRFHINLQLFNATSHLEQYHEIISLGIELIKQDASQTLLDSKNKESIIGQVANAYLRRSEYKEAELFIENNPLTNPSFEFKIAVEAEVYLQNSKADKAIESIVRGVIIRRRIFPEEYAKLYFSFTRISNITSFEPTPLNIVSQNSFVKLRNQERWYFIGDAIELDATKIHPQNERYNLFLNKKIGDKIIFKKNYGMPQKEDIIENILSIERYILWQSIFHFRNLIAEDRLEGAKIVKIADTDGAIDLNILNGFLKDTCNSSTEFFEVYCKNPVPLSFLAVNQGGIASAIGRIQSEGKGFINSCSGTFDEISAQQNIARRILEKGIPFYLDGTSAIFLSEIGYLDKIYKYLPNIKVPQSVINLLSSLTERFTFHPGSVGMLGYARGRAVFSPIEKGKVETIRANFRNSIKLLESNPSNIKTISLVNKADCFYEQDIPAELCDACILAEKEGAPILTEDYLFLKAREIETGKKAPLYFSSLILLRILLDENRINFDDYVNFFAYLSSYRFRFLSFNSDDILRTVLGDGEIKIVKPENIAKLNFPLTLSEEYGVTFNNAFTVVIGFLMKILDDNTILADISERIFIEAISAFPTQKNKKLIGQMFLSVCNRIIAKRRTISMLEAGHNTLKDKLDRLSKATEIWNVSDQLWLPSK